MAVKKIFFKLAIFATLSLVAAQEPLSFSQKVAVFSKRVIDPQTPDDIYHNASDYEKTEKPLAVGVYLCLYSGIIKRFVWPLNSLKYVTAGAVTGAAIGMAGGTVFSYGSHALRDCYTGYQLKNNKNLHVSSSLEEKVRKIVHQRVPECNFNSKIFFVKDSSCPSKKAYATASRWRWGFNVIAFSPSMIHSMQKCSDSNKPLSFWDLKTLLHEAGHIRQEQADFELEQAIKDGWLPFLSDEHKKNEVAVDLFAINRLTLSELEANDLAGDANIVHDNGYLTSAQLNFIMKKRHGSLASDNKL
jgi:hypothetical protein